MFSIRKAQLHEYERVRAFYYELIDRMEGAVYKPAWEKGVYPADEYLKESIDNGELYMGILDEGRPEEQMIGAMILNHSTNEGYQQVKWPTKAEADEVTVIHALCVMPGFSGKGYAKAMVKEAISMARESQQKVIRLDVLYGNVPAEKLYTSVGFQYIATVPMYYEDTGWTDFLLYEYEV